MQPRTARPLSASRGRTVTINIAALLIGVIAGLRTMTAPAAVSLAAYLRALRLRATPLGFLASTVTPYMITLLAIAELASDQLPNTPSRKVPMQFGARLVSGGFCGAAVGMAGGSRIAGLVAGVIGAVIGTLGGAAARQRIAAAPGRDLPAASPEDVVAIGGAALLMEVLG